MSLGTEVGLYSSDIVLDGNPAPPPTKRDTVAPTFRPMTIVAKRSPISETAEVLVNSAICREAARRAGSSATADTCLVSIGPGFHLGNHL